MLGFGSLDVAIRAGLDLRAFDPVSCDLLERRLLASTKTPPAVAAAPGVTCEQDSEREALERVWGAIEKRREAHRLAARPDGVLRFIANARSPTPPAQLPLACCA